MRPCAFVLAILVVIPMWNTVAGARERGKSRLQGRCHCHAMVAACRAESFEHAPRRRWCATEYKRWQRYGNDMGRVLDNVDPRASDEDRVRAMWGIISHVVEDLDSDKPSAQRLTIKRFMLYLTAHEGDRIRARTQSGGGPGRSFFQFEPAKAKDAVDYARSLGLTDRLAVAAGATEGQITTAAGQLQLGQPWPRYNLIEQKLRAEDRDLFAAYLSRFALKRIDTAIPSDDAQHSQHAEYWAAHWKIVFSSPQDRLNKIAQFKTNAGWAFDLIP